jgi:hypothetical protein
VEKIVDEFNLFAISMRGKYSTICPQCEASGDITKVIFDRDDYKSSPIIKEIYYKCKCGRRNLVKSPDHSDIGKIFFDYKPNNINNEKLIFNSRIAVSEGQRIMDIFTSRNFSVLDSLIGYVKETDTEDREILNYIILSVLHLSKITDTHSNSQWPLWTPKKNCVEKNVIDLILKRSKALILSIRDVNNNLHKDRRKVSNYNKMRTGDYMIIQKGIQHLSHTDIPDNSVDLVITDPPYLGQVLYSEYMQLYKPFLKLKLNLEDEIVVSSSPERNKKEEDYYRLLNLSFEKISSKMKDYKYMCMYFHDSNLSVWNRLIKMMQKHGLRYISQVHIKKKNTLKNIISPKKSLNGDAILFFIKEPLLEIGKVQLESIEEMERNIIKHAKYIIKSNGPTTTPELYDDGLMEFIIHNGWLEKLSNQYKSLVDIFEKYLIWDSELGKWKT